jgi:hypothetical protein
VACPLERFSILNIVVSRPTRFPPLPMAGSSVPTNARRLDRWRAAKSISRARKSRVFTAEMVDWSD